MAAASEAEGAMITVEQVRAMVAAAEEKARSIGVPANIAVLDAGAHLKAFIRMDGAVLGSIDVAMRKARTAVLFDGDERSGLGILQARRARTWPRAFQRRARALRGRHSAQGPAAARRSAPSACRAAPFPRISKSPRPPSRRFNSDLIRCQQRRNYPCRRPFSSPARAPASAKPPRSAWPSNGHNVIATVADLAARHAAAREGESARA